MAGLQTCEKAAEAAEVTAFWQDLGLPGLVDVHTHFMPPNVQAKVWAVIEQAWPIAYRQPEPDRIALLRAFGVCRFGALAYPHKPGTNIPYPYAHQLRALARLDLGPAWLRGVCHDNAARLLGL